MALEENYNERYYINGSISLHTHPVYRHNTRCILRILHEAGDERKNTPYSHGICGGCHGCGVDMESHSPRYGAVGGHGQAVVHPRGDRILGGNTTEGVKSSLAKTTMMVLAVTLHNIPEGMAVGVVLAGFVSGKTDISAAGALALSIGIAIQNFPEGAIISMPLRSEGMKKPRAFVGGVLSGIVEPIGAVLTVLASGFITPALPYLLSFAAGAMLYVVVEELIPEMSQGEHSNLGTIFFAVGFSLMMVLDVALG